MKEETIIKILRNVIPKMKCKITCSDCCGPIPFSKWEWEQIQNKKYSVNGVDCPYISFLGCEIYNDRPIMCRLFGTSKNDKIECPYGHIAVNPLSEEISRQIVRIYGKIIQKGKVRALTKTT